MGFFLFLSTSVYYQTLTLLPPQPPIHLSLNTSMTLSWLIAEASEIINPWPSMSFPLIPSEYYPE